MKTLQKLHVEEGHHTHFGNQDQTSYSQDAPKIVSSVSTRMWSPTKHDLDADMHLVL